MYRKIINRYKEFGIKISTSLFLCKLYNYKYHNNLIAWKLLQRHHKNVLMYLRSKYNHIIERYKAYSCRNNKDNSKQKFIWVFWWQGEAEAPELVHICIDSIRTHNQDSEVVVISQYNYEKYIYLPPYIVEKVQNGAITLTHLSDIVRACLLYEHGGLWLDATIYNVSKIPVELFSYNYYTCKLSPQKISCISQAQWAGYLFGAKKESIVPGYLRSFFFDYWKKEKSLIDYYLIDYIMYIGVHDIPEIRKLFEAIPLNNPNILKLQDNMNLKFEKAVYKELTEDTFLFKLQRRLEYYKNDKGGKMTFYGYMWEECYKRRDRLSK